MNIIRNTGLTFESDGAQVESKPICKNLVVYVDLKLSFNTRINVVLKKLGKHLGIVSKLGNSVPRIELKLFYRTNTQPTIEYGVLFYGCYSSTSLLPVVKMKRKLVRLITLEKKFRTLEEQGFFYLGPKTSSSRVFAQAALKK